MIPPVPSKKTSSNGVISFPALQCWNPMTNVATIAAEVDGKRVSCRIKIEDLKKKFQFFSSEPMQMVTKYRTEIEAAARDLIVRMKYEDDGSIMIQYGDL